MLLILFIVIRILYLFWRVAYFSQLVDNGSESSNDNLLGAIAPALAVRIATKAHTDDRWDENGEFDLAGASIVAAQPPSPPDTSLSSAATPT